jgi:transposase InsO family protein
VTGVYEFIDAEYATCENAPAVTKMCAWLDVSKSGFYDWKSRPESATAERRKKLSLIISRVFDDSDSTYGHRRIAAQLARQGIIAGEELVRKLMRELGPVACQPRPWRRESPGTRRPSVRAHADASDRSFPQAAGAEAQHDQRSRSVACRRQARSIIAAPAAAATATMAVAAMNAT